MATTERWLEFTITGTITIPMSAELLYDAFGQIRGWNYEGKQVLLQAALEVDEGKEILYSDKEMQKIGCTIQEYHETSLSEHSD